MKFVINFYLFYHIIITFFERNYIVIFRIYRIAHQCNIIIKWIRIIVIMALNNDHIYFIMCGIFTLRNLNQEMHNISFY